MTLSHCRSAPPTIAFDAKLFFLGNDGLRYQGELFSGKLRRENSQTERVETYLSGKRNGLIVEYFRQSGRVSKQMYFADGKRVGLHRGYYPSGERQFEMNYLDGVYHGDVTYWYRSGQVYTYTLYERGKVKGHKMWRKNGRIFANYVMRNGKKVGLNGGKLCLNVKDNPKSDSVSSERSH